MEKITFKRLLALIVTLLALAGSVSAVDPEQMRRDLDAQLAAIDPLSTSSFERNHGAFDVMTHGATQDITAHYRVTNPALRNQDLRNEVIRLFREAGWSQGTGNATMDLAFAKDPFVLKEREYGIHHAYLHFSEDGAKIHCTYGYRSQR